MLVGERLRAARKERGLSLADLARATDLSKGFISQVESGVSNPSLASLRKLTSALGLSPGETLDETSGTRATGGATQISQQPGTGDRIAKIELEDITVHSAAVAGHASPGGIVPLFASTQQGQAVIFTLAPHETVLSNHTNDVASGIALCAVLEGTVRVERTGVVAVARQGEVASFHAGRPYEATNLSSRRATLLLILPFGHELPRRADLAHRANIQGQPSPAAGPFRIVEMRAGRGVRERGR